MDFLNEFASSVAF